MQGGGTGWGAIIREAFLGNLVSLTSSSLQILGKTQIFNFRFSGKIKTLINKNGHNFRNSNRIHMKPGPVTKLDKSVKILDDDVVSINYYINCHFSNLPPIWSNPKAGL